MSEPNTSKLIAMSLDKFTKGVNTFHLPINLLTSVLKLYLHQILNFSCLSWTSQTFTVQLTGACQKTPKFSWTSPLLKMKTPQLHISANNLAMAPFMEDSPHGASGKFLFPLFSFFSLFLFPVILFLDSLYLLWLGCQLAWFLFWLSTWVLRAWSPFCFFSFLLWFHDQFVRVVFLFPLLCINSLLYPWNKIEEELFASLRYRGFFPSLLDIKLISSMQK